MIISGYQYPCRLAFDIFVRQWMYIFLSDIACAPATHHADDAHRRQDRQLTKSPPPVDFYRSLLNLKNRCSVSSIPIYVTPLRGPILKTKKPATVARTTKLFDFVLSTQVSFRAQKGFEE